MESSYCSGYLDPTGNWSPSFYCPQQSESLSASICCGNTKFKYCCTDPEYAAALAAAAGGDEDLVSIEATTTYLQPVEIPVIIGIITCGMFLIVISCYLLCSGFFKKRHLWSHGVYHVHHPTNSMPNAIGGPTTYHWQLNPAMILGPNNALSVNHINKASLPADDDEAADKERKRIAEEIFKDPSCLSSLLPPSVPSSPVLAPKKASRVSPDLSLLPPPPVPSHLTNGHVNPISSFPNPGILKYQPDFTGDPHPLPCYMHLHNNEEQDEEQQEELTDEERKSSGSSQLPTIATINEFTNRSSSRSFSDDTNENDTEEDESHKLKCVVLVDQEIPEPVAAFQKQVKAIPAAPPLPEMNREKSPVPEIKPPVSIRPPPRTTSASKIPIAIPPPDKKVRFNQQNGAPYLITDKRPPIPNHSYYYGNNNGNNRRRPATYHNNPGNSSSGVSNMGRIDISPRISAYSTLPLPGSIRNYNGVGGNAIGGNRRSNHCNGAGNGNGE